jgi:hypothetical protein
LSPCCDLMITASGGRAMAKDGLERSPIGRTVLGGAAGGFTYDGALSDAVAREERLRRPLRLGRWQGDAGRAAPPLPADAARELAEAGAPRSPHPA